MGALRIFPATRQAVAPDGKAELLEPRVMQVLVALARAKGEVVGRDALIQHCWDGTVVGDNAIQRAVSRVRDLAAGLGGDSFRIDTIARVGYRLCEGDQASLPTIPIEPPPRVRRRYRFVLVLSLVLILAAGAAIWWRAAPAESVAVAIETDGDSPILGEMLTSDLGRLGAATGTQFRISGPLGAAGADYRLTFIPTSGGGMHRVVARLSSARADRLLWSASIGPAAETHLLHEPLAAAVGSVLTCAAEPADPRLRQDENLFALVLTVCQSRARGWIHTPPRELILLTQRKPDCAWCWGELAHARAVQHVAGSFEDSATVSGGAALAELSRLVRRDAARARSLQPDVGAAWVAELLLVPRQSWELRQRMVARGLAASPAEARLYAQRADVLAAVGRVSESFANARRALELAPLDPWMGAGLVSHAAHAGEYDIAREALGELERRWPHHPATRETRFFFELRYGDAAALLQDPGNASSLEGWVRPFLRARAEPSPANIAAAMSLDGRRVEDFGSLPIWYVQTLGTFGQTDRAYELFRDPQVLEGLKQGTEVLFRPHMRSIRNDRRFIGLAARLGLTAYWTSTGHWPDFCSIDLDLPYDCVAEARALSSSPPTGRPTHP